MCKVEKNVDYCLTARSALSLPIMPIWDEAYAKMTRTNR